MPSSGIVAIDPANNDAAVIDASTLAIAPEEYPPEQQQHETSKELSQEDDDEQLSPMPRKKASLVTPRTDRKVASSPVAGNNTTTNAQPSSHTPKPSKGKSKKKVAVATPVAAEESSTPKKSKKSSSKASAVPMKTMKHFFGNAGVVKAKKVKATSSSTKNDMKVDDKPLKKGVDTSLAEPSPSADSAGEDMSKVKTDNNSGTIAKKEKATTKSKPKQPQKNAPAKKKAKAAPKSSPVDIVSIEDMDDSPMDALAIVSRRMSAGHRGRRTSASLGGRKKEEEKSSVETKSPSDGGKDAVVAASNDTPKPDGAVIQVEEATSASTVASDKEIVEVVPTKEQIDVTESDDDDDATVAMDDADAPATFLSGQSAPEDKDDALSELPGDGVECTEEESTNVAPIEKDESSTELTEDKIECIEEDKKVDDKGNDESAIEKDEEPAKDQPAVIIIDEPTLKVDSTKKDDPPSSIVKAVEAAPSKKTRDPNAPKKSKSALDFYRIAKRSEFKAANPDTKAGDITKLMSAEFKKLDAKDKAVWEEQAKEDKLRYKNEMAAYKPPEQLVSTEKSEKKAAVDEPAKKKEAKPTILTALASCTPKAKGDKSTKAQPSSTKKASPVPAAKAKPVLSEEENAQVQKFAALKEKYNLRGVELKSRPASDDFSEENLSVENGDLPSLDKGSVKVEGSFPDQLLPYLMVIAQGSALPLSKLAMKALQDLSIFVNEANPLTLELVSSKIKLLAQRKSFLNASSQLDCFEDNEEGHMWRWELSSLDLLPSKDASKVKKARTARKKLQSHHKAILNLVSAIDKAVSSIETKSSSSKKLIAKVSDMEEKVLKFEREEETARLLSQAKAKKQAEDTAKKEEEKERKKMEAAKAAEEREAAKQRKAEEKEKEKLAKQQEIEEKENKRKARMMSFFSKGSAKKKQKLATTPQKEDSVACNASTSFDTDSFRRAINSQTSISSPFARVTRKRKTQNVRVSVFVTTMSDNPFSQQPYDEEKIITVPNAYKFLGFHEDVRPPYHGTWSKTSSIVTGRNPFGQDTTVLDYEVDSEAEWEEGDDEQGEDLNEDAGEEEEDEGPQDEDNDGWLAAEDDLGIDDEDEETRELRKRKLHMETTLQKSGHYKACVVAPQMGGIPHNADCDITIVEGFSLTNALDALCSHVGCVLAPGINEICLDAFAPSDSAKNSDQTKDSSGGQSDEMTSEAKKIVAQFVHNCTVNSKEKLVTELLKAHPSISKSRAQTTREVDFMAEKKKVPKEAGGGVVWEVRPDILKTLGLEEKDLKQAPKVVSHPQKSTEVEANPTKAVTKPPEDGGKKKKKDPNAPKKPKSSFMYFSSSKRAEVKAANPEASFGELGKILGSLWKQLSDSDKTEYEERAEADKKRYQKEMENYTPSVNASDSGSNKDLAKKAKKEKSEVKKDQNSTKQNSKSTPSPNNGSNSTKKRKTPPVSAASANLFAAFLKRKKTT